VGVAHVPAAVPSRLKWGAQNAARQDSSDDIRRAQVAEIQALLATGRDRERVAEGAVQRNALDCDGEETPLGPPPPLPPEP